MKGWIDVIAYVITATILTRLKTTSAVKVTTTHGEIEGNSVVIDGVTVDIYLGIPFAKPPVGDLRFRAPAPMDPWTGVKETKTLPNSCIQTRDGSFKQFKGVEMWNANTELSEDCLYLNLWVPRTNNTSKITMVWIYGGSFISGTSTLDVYDGQYLAARQGIIVASLQYRLGVLGFLYTGTEGAPGNMGLLDQQAAMSWIYYNVEIFGGDNNKITLVGESAGAASVSHHLLANSSWPYFNNAIMLSGTSLSPWAVDKPENLLQDTQTFAKRINCSDSDLGEILMCLRSMDAMTLEDNQWYLNNKKIGTFSPTIDGHFLTDFPANLLSSGKIKDTDILLGNTKDEGEYFMIYFYPDLFPPEFIDNPPPLNRNQFLKAMREESGCQDDLECDGVLYTYESSALPSKRGSYRDMLDDLIGDLYFKCSVRSLASYHFNVTNKRIYLYSFDYRHSANPWPSWMDVLHGYEIELMFGLPFNPQLNFSALDRTVSAKVMEFFTTFAETGNLTSVSSEWPEYTTNSEQHIVFSQNGTTYVREGFRTKECSFWEYLMPKLKQQSSDKGTTSGVICHSFSTILVSLSVIILQISSVD